jgi:hypothetical protein
MHEVLRVSNMIHFLHASCIVSEIQSQEPAEAHQSFSSSTHPTIWHTILVLKYLQETWSTMELSSKFTEISLAIRAGLDNLEKWYCTTEKTDTYFICLGMY